jgi:hypothetical protein
MDDEMKMRIESLTERVLKLETENAQLWKALGKIMACIDRLTLAATNLAEITDGLVNRALFADRQTGGLH